MNIVPVKYTYVPYWSPASSKRPEHGGLVLGVSMTHKMDGIAWEYEFLSYCKYTDTWTKDGEFIADLEDRIWTELPENPYTSKLPG